MTVVIMLCAWAVAVTWAAWERRRYNALYKKAAVAMLMYEPLAPPPAPQAPAQWNPTTATASAQMQHLQQQLAQFQTAQSQLSVYPGKIWLLGSALGGTLGGLIGKPPGTP